MLMLAFALGATLATDPGQADAASTLTVHLRIDQDGALPTSDLRRAVEEIKKIWETVGVTVTFGKHADPIPDGAAAVSVRIVPTEHQPRGVRAVLGWVVVNPGGTLLPTLFISRTGIVDLLGEARSGRPFDQLPPAVFDRLLSQTIGRVAAHELGHYLLQTKHHVGRGLMRGCYTTPELIAGWVGPFHIPSADRPAMRRAIAWLAEAQQSR